MATVREDVAAAIGRLREVGTDTTTIEAKSASGGLPKTVVETVSAFANTKGGLLVLGVNEEDGFSIVDIDSAKLATDLAATCADQLEPPVLAEIEVVVVEGRPIVAARIDELPVERKPCYVKSRGLHRGSFHRSHDGDRVLSTYEVHVLLSSHGQPRDDEVPVDGASTDDLDQDLVDGLVRRLRTTRSMIFGTASAEDILEQLGVTRRMGDRVVPTLAGLLALARYPQRHLPQLNATFVAYPTTSGEPLLDGTRFRDNQAIDGPIPVIVTEALNALRRNMRRRAVVSGLAREDIWEYPEEAVRELLTNALLHRDYHPMAGGTQVRIELFPDRLVISSPGGLFGPVSFDDLMSERVSSSRNATLAKLLEDVAMPGADRRVCENRGSGLVATAAALRRAGMQPPVLRDSVREFTVTVYNHGLLDDESLAWLSTVDTAGLSSNQRLGLALARRAGSISNQEYRTLIGTDPGEATRDLQALGSRGLLVKSSDGRWARWRLAPSLRPDDVPEQPRLDLDTPTVVTAARRGDRRHQILTVLAQGPRSATELGGELGLTREGVLRWLRRMESDGQVRATAAARTSVHNRWELT